MLIFRHGRRRAAKTITSSRTHITRSYASKIDIPFAPPQVPVIETCPSPKCACRESPPGLDIERETNINGSMASYAEQILLCTGKPDWKSRIEDEEDAALLKQLKANLIRGKYADPYHNVLITNSSFPSAPLSQTQQPTQPTSELRPNHISNPGKDPEFSSQSTPSGPPMSAFLLPSFQFVPSILPEAGSVEAFIKGFVLPSKLHHAHDRLTQEQKNILLRDEVRQHEFPNSRPINEILILICGHGGRDERCGKLGPILHAEFEEKLSQQNITVLKDPLEGKDVAAGLTARVGLISHIGGHKWAGNVVVYVPPSLEGNALAGKGICYGRVAPEHVEGSVGETVLAGKVIRELFRGGVERGGGIIRL